MKHIMRSALVILSLFSVPVFAEEPQKSPPAAEVETITMRPGETKILEAVDLTRLVIGDPEIADVKVLGSEVFRIDSFKVGETTLLVWSMGKERKDYRIVVQK